MPCRFTGRGRMRGSPVGGATTISSKATSYRRASGMSRSSVGLRSPDSSRDIVLMPTPSAFAASVRVIRRLVRSARRVGPTPRMMVPTSSLMCHPLLRILQISL
jgi:hypothetical protein